MENSYNEDFLENMSELYYNPERGDFGNKSMNLAIFYEIRDFSNDEIEKSLGNKIFNLYINHKNNFNKEIKDYLEFFEEIIDDHKYIKKKEEWLRINGEDDDLKKSFISARLRKNIFGDYKNKKYSSLSDFFSGFEGDIKEKVGKSLEYIFTNYPDNEAVNVMDPKLFRIYIKEKYRLKHNEFNNFYIHAEGLIKNFKNLNNEEKNSKLLEKLVKKKGLKEKILAKRMLSYFLPEHYVRYGDDMIDKHYGKENKDEDENNE